MRGGWNGGVREGCREVPCMYIIGSMRVTVCTSILGV